MHRVCSVDPKEFERSAGRKGWPRSQCSFWGSPLQGNIPVSMIARRAWLVRTALLPCHFCTTESE